MSMTDLAPLLERFEKRRIPAPDFRHLDHIQVAFEILDKYDFFHACARYASTIQAMVESVGAPGKFNATITVAFMSVIAERKSQMEGVDFESFIAANLDLLDRNALRGWYTKERLNSPAARHQFLMPDKVAGESA